MDAVGKAERIPRILGAGHNALVRLTLPMKALEVNMVVRQDGASVGDGIRKNNVIANALVRSACFLNSTGIMT
jgi:hypothetical protein